MKIADKVQEIKTVNFYIRRDKPLDYWFAIFHIYEKIRMINYKLTASLLSAIVLMSTLVWLALNVGNLNAQYISMAVLIAGASSGWMLGIFISPYDTFETTQFTRLSKVIGVFLTGYLAGKIDKVIGQLLDPSLLLESLHGFRLLTGLSAFFISLTITFVFRRYGNAYIG